MRFVGRRNEQNRSMNGVRNSGVRGVWYDLWRSSENNNGSEGMNDTDAGAPEHSRSTIIMKRKHDDDDDDDERLE